MSPLHSLSDARLIFSFAKGQAHGGRDLKELLGGKGANLAEMCKLGLPVPPGFTITTAVCREYFESGRKLPAALQPELEAALAQLEQQTGKRLGCEDNPLLVSVRSGARVSMPGMMDTVLNLGLNPETTRALARRTSNPRFAWDSYRRFIQMYSSVVLGIKAKHELAHDPFSIERERLRQERGLADERDFTAEDLEELVARYLKLVHKHTRRHFPADPREQLQQAIRAVFESWNSERAGVYRAMHGIPSDWGTACSIVAMVFGNMGSDSGTGVAFTRDPNTGERRFFGEYLANAQGEDVVAGLRTPQPIESLMKTQPAAWQELLEIQARLEDHYTDMQDLEFTIENGRLYMLQCRSGKRTGIAAVRIAVDMVKEGRIRVEDALLRVEARALDQLLQPIFAVDELKNARDQGRLVAKGLPAGPGAACGRIAFSAARARELAAGGDPVVLVRIETSPEDILGMQASAGILTARGGMTSHAALVARQMGKVCVVGAEALAIDYATRSLRAGRHELTEGMWISIDGSSGCVWSGRITTQPSEVVAALLARPQKSASKSPLLRCFEQLMRWADEHRTLGVRTNADQADQAAVALAFGAEGIGLCRTEHMFFAPEKIRAVREMILAEDAEGRERALAQLLPLQRADFEALFAKLAPRPVTIRLLDPPLHEFLPQDAGAIAELSRSMQVPQSALEAKVQGLHEINPMLGHRGCRLGISHPEITAMQARAIFEAACAVAKRTGKAPRLEIMVPLVATREELERQAALVRDVAASVQREQKKRVPYQIGTMIELPRAALTAGEIAQCAEFFSFGTNDLTQTTFGISRDDGARFIPRYIELGILEVDPFESLDTQGVGKLMRIAVEDGRAARRPLKVGVCGEHGGDPRSIEFCHALGLDYVSCSPWRVPLARLAAAQAALRRIRALETAAAEREERAQSA